MLFSRREPDGRQLAYPPVSRRIETIRSPLVELLLKCGGGQAASARQRERCPEPPLDGSHQRLTFLLPKETALLGATATDVLLDGIELCDMLERLARNGRRTRGGKFGEVTPHADQQNAS
ncbi:hypothetical protein LMTR13_23965 [Bradyrhizobium icense]|uniref:Uncharacterized protein n=1 Tax=Bradyrhizobium icense TaxID=1274631 RepID=A0A1B1UJ08_9BRAD|nr:hypothetical protein LMTR13_23965 [Bradyrhizobium icense]